MARPKWLSNRLPPTDAEEAKLWAATDELVRGDLMEYDQIEKLTGFEKGDPLFQRVVTRWKRKLLRDRGISVRAEPKVGYKLLTGDDQQDQSIRILKQADRRNRKAALVSGVVEAEDMTEAGVAIQAAVAMHTEEMDVARKKSLAKHSGVLARPRALPRPS